MIVEKAAEFSSLFEVRTRLITLAIDKTSAVTASVSGANQLRPTAAILGVAGRTFRARL
jgi:hypothetical protein